MIPAVIGMRNHLGQRERPRGEDDEDADDGVAQDEIVLMGRDDVVGVLDDVGLGHIAWKRPPGGRTQHAFGSNAREARPAARPSYNVERSGKVPPRRALVRSRVALPEESVIPDKREAGRVPAAVRTRIC